MVRFRQHARRKRVAAEMIVQPASVHQQVPYRDGLRVIAIARQEPRVVRADPGADRRVNGQAALLHQAQDRSRHKGLGVGGDTHRRPRRHRPAVRIRDASRGGVEFVAQHGDGKPGNVAVAALQIVEPLLQFARPRIDRARHRKRCRLTA
ncbi:MAG: hypothetical protein AAF515_11700 [Pseudomonadota bacterium]